MADPFIAEIRIFPFNFAPKGWAWCDGQLMPLSQNTALFSLLGTTYGGNGKDNFALPDLSGRAPMQPGQGPGLSLRDLGEIGGTETVALLETEIPAHNHGINVSQRAGIDRDPESNFLGMPEFPVYSDSGGSISMDVNAISVTGSDQPHNNMQPYLTFYFCIALQGVFPPRT